MTPAPTLPRLEAERARLLARLRGLPEGPERWGIQNRLFELRCAIRVARERAKGLRWRCSECGAVVAPSDWLEFCPCGGRWEVAR